MAIEFFEYFSRPGLAEHLTQVLGRKITVEQLEQWATKRIGPPFVIMLGRAQYPKPKVAAWLQEIALSPDEWREQREGIRARNKRRAEQLAEPVPKREHAPERELVTA